MRFEKPQSAPKVQAWPELTRPEVPTLVASSHEWIDVAHGAVTVHLTKSAPLNSTHQLRIPMKPDAYSKVKPDIYSVFIPDSVPI
jgi:hypothetical protein